MECIEDRTVIDSVPLQQPSQSAVISRVQLREES